MIPSRLPVPTGSRPINKLKRNRDSTEQRTAMAFQSSAPTFLNHFLAVPQAPTRKLSQRISGKVKPEVEDFLSSDVERDLELSFASTMSIHSPPRNNIALPLKDDSREYVPMDISPAPPRAPKALLKSEESRKVVGRPRAFTSSARLFGADVSNSHNPSLVPPLPSTRSGSGTSGNVKKLQRSMLPLEWTDSTQQGDHTPHLFDQPQAVPPSPATDAMDVDTSFAQVLSSSVPKDPVPPSATTTFDLGGSAGPLSAAPTIGSFQHLFYDAMSPPRGHGVSVDSTSASVDESPLQPFPKKRRSASPTRGREEPTSGNLANKTTTLKRQSSFSSSSIHTSSLPVEKLERPTNVPTAASKKATLAGLGAPLTLNVNNKRPRRPVLSAMVPPVDASASGHSGIMEGKENKGGPQLLLGLAPVRRAFSAMVPTSILDQSLSSEDGISFDQDGPDMSSPAQAYAKRQQVKTIRRCDGTDDFRPSNGVSALVSRDNDVKQRGLRRSEDRVQRPANGERDTPRSKYLLNSSGGGGLGGFGDNESFGKLLPCHRVKEDGLMRITWKTMEQLLDGVYANSIASFRVIDCRFDYEYNGGHIPGAININTTGGVEEFFLGTNALKPEPSTSGDAHKKTILVFHCEFSCKRAPTFAKHLRSKDRAMNNHMYPKIHFPEVYVLEGGFCQFFKECATRCEPIGYVRMDDPHYAQSRREDLDQFRKAKFGRTKSYAYGEGKNGLSAALQQPSKRNTAPNNGTTTLFAAANAARSRRNGMLQTLEEDPSGAVQSDEDETDIGDSPCPPPTKAVTFKGKKFGRAPLARAETYGPSRMNFGL